MQKIELIEEQILGCLLLDGRFVLHGNEEKLASITWRYKTHAYIYAAIMNCLDKFGRIDPALVFIMQEGERFSLEHILEMSSMCSIVAFDDYLEAHKMLVEEINKS